MSSPSPGLPWRAWRRLLLAWCVLAIVMSANGVFRELVLRPSLGPRAAAVASAAIGIALLLLVTRTLFPSLVDHGPRTLAVVSLVFGILGWTLLPFLGSLVAVVCGHMARGEIRRAQGALEGDGMAVAGLVLGYLVIGLSVLAVMAAILFFGGLAALIGLAGMNGSL